MGILISFVGTAVEIILVGRGILLEFVGSGREITWGRVELVRVLNLLLFLF